MTEKMTDLSMVGEKSIQSIVDQLISEGRSGSLEEVTMRNNYLSHVRTNPTKSLSEAIVYLYEQLDGLHAFVTKGVTDSDIDLIREVNMELVKKREVGVNVLPKLELMLGSILKRREDEKIPQGNGLCIAVSTDKRHILVVDVPSRVDQE